MNDLEKVCEAKNRLVEWVNDEINTGKACVYNPLNLAPFGSLVDAAKDMAELEEKSAKAEYYKCLVCEMLEDAESGEERYGYDRWHYASGKFAPKGHGHRVGYSDPFRGNVHVHDPNVDGMFRMGYPMDRDQHHSRYGTGYDDYMMAKRHYTESRKEDDRRMMNSKIEEAVMDTVTAAKEMWRDATPETRKGMKAAFTKMLEEMV